MASHGEAPCAARGLAPCARRRSRERRALRWLAPGLGRRMLTDTSRKTAWSAKDGNGQTCASPAVAGPGGKHKLYPAKRAPVYTGAARTGSRRQASAASRPLPQPGPASAEVPGPCLRKRALSPALPATGAGWQEAAIVSPPAGPPGRQGQQASSACLRRDAGIGRPPCADASFPPAMPAVRGSDMPPASAVQACAGQRRFFWAKVWQAGLGAHRPSRTAASAASSACFRQPLCLQSRGQRRAEAALACPVCPQPAPAQASRAMGRCGGESAGQSRASAGACPASVRGQSPCLHTRGRNCPARASGAPARLRPSAGCALRPPAPAA